MKALAFGSATLCTIALSLALSSSPAQAYSAPSAYSSDGASVVATSDSNQDSAADALAATGDLYSTNSPIAADDSLSGTNAVPGDGGGSPNDVYWTDKGGRSVRYSSSVQQKVQAKHGLTNNTVKLSTQRAQRDAPDGPTNRVFRFSVSTVNDSGVIVRGPVIIRTVVDYKVNNGLQYGVVTSYCEGYDGACPSWVNGIR